MVEETVTTPEESPQEQQDIARAQQKLIIIEVLGERQYSLARQNIALESIPTILRKVALDTETSILR